MTGTGKTVCPECGGRLLYTGDVGLDDECFVSFAIREYECAKCGELLSAVYKFKEVVQSPSETELWRTFIEDTGEQDG